VSTMLRAQERRGVHSVMSSGRTTFLEAPEWHRGLGNGACVVDVVSSSGGGRWRRVKGLDRDQERWCEGSREDSTMAWRAATIISSLLM
jgi:hypothetical protein